MRQLIQLAKKAQINPNADIKDQHSIVINAPIEKVWQLLYKINEWSKWNPKISQINIGDEVVEKTKFTWKIDNILFNSEIQLLEKPTLITWIKKSYFIKGIDVWKLEQDEGHTIVTVDTSLQGLFTPFFIHHQQVYKELLFWLDCLKKVSEKTDN